MSEVFSGRKGRFVSLNDTIAGFGSLLEGEGDEYPEAAFYMMGTLEESFEEGAYYYDETGKIVVEKAEIVI